MQNIRTIPKRVIDLHGQKFGRLTVVSYAGPRKPQGSMWFCVCDCGSKGEHEGRDLRRGDTKSCGCLRAEETGKRFSARQSTLGERVEFASEYGVYAGMIQRGHNPKNKNYPRYGAVGRTVCDRWRFGESGQTGFRCFVDDMGIRPDPKMSIDRIDNNAGYSPHNCRWATAQEQRANR